MLLDQVLQQLNVCRISKKRKVKAQFEGKQARLEGLPEQQLSRRTAPTATTLWAVGDDDVLPVTSVANEHLKPDRSIASSHLSIWSRLTPQRCS